ncbi:hypothetical protein ACHAWF_006142 [Thalassiosira exigua]
MTSFRRAVETGRADPGVGASCPPLARRASEDWKMATMMTMRGRRRWSPMSAGICMASLLALIVAAALMSGSGSTTQPKQTITTTKVDWVSDETWFREQDWVRDETWFQSQVRRGCCPFAKTIYESRYANVEHRCCTSRLEEGRIDPLRAVGGVDYSQLPRGGKRPTTVLIQGDSLAEQHFLGMICSAWSHDDLTVDLRRLSDRTGQDEGTAWRANVFVVDGRSGERDRLLISIQYLRWNRPTAAPRASYDLLDVPDCVVLGGWHHGGADAGSIERLVTRTRAEGTHGRGGQRVVVVDALPSHFPGGKYLASGEYPSAAGDDVCARTSSEGDPPNVNEMLGPIAENRANVTLLRISRLYHRRGNAHVGLIPEETVGPKGRDCLHWCIAPGVLDALTRMTLAAIYDGS